MKTLELVVLSRLQGAGKSRFLRSRYVASHAVVSKDRMGNRRRKGVRQEKELREHLGRGRSVVVDNMNLTVADGLVRNRGTYRVAVPEIGVYASARAQEVPGEDEGLDQMYSATVSDAGEIAVEKFP